MCPLIDPNLEDRPQIAPGIYRARIVSCELKIGKTGSKYLNWKFETIPEKKWVFHTNGLTGKGAEVLKDIVRASKFPDYQGGPINTDDLIGSMLMITLAPRLNPDGSESPYMQVAHFNPDPENFDSFEGDFGT